MRLSFSAAFFPVFATSLLAADTNWPQFRGPNACGVMEDAQPPGEFGVDKALAWKAAVPEGISSPIVWGERVFVTGMEGGKPRMLCLSRKDGSVLWTKEVPAAKTESVHKVSHPVSATPVTDGQGVVGWFPAFGLMAWNMEGGEVWRKELEMPFVVNGSGTSPILAGGRMTSPSGGPGSTRGCPSSCATTPTAWPRSR